MQLVRAFLWHDDLQVIPANRQGQEFLLQFNLQVAFEHLIGCKSGILELVSMSSELFLLRLIESKSILYDWFELLSFCSMALVGFIVLFTDENSFAFSVS